MQSVLGLCAFKLCHKAVIELLGGIVSHLLLAVVHRRDLDNDGHVTSGGYGNGERGELDAEDLAGLVVKAEAVIELAVS